MFTKTFLSGMKLLQKSQIPRLPQTRLISRHLLVLTYSNNHSTLCMFVYKIYVRYFPFALLIVVGGYYLFKYKIVRHTVDFHESSSFCSGSENSTSEVKKITTQNLVIAGVKEEEKQPLLMHNKLGLTYNQIE